MTRPLTGLARSPQTARELEKVRSILDAVEDMKEFAWCAFYAVAGAVAALLLQAVLERI